MILNNIPFPLLTTERLVLRKMAATDDEAVFLMRSDVAGNKYIARLMLKELSEAQQYITRVITGVDEGIFINWAITLKDTGAFVGLISLLKFSEDGTMAETGYQLDTSCHGQGLMTEALNCVVNYGFGKLKLKSIEAYTNKDNSSSIKLLLNNGFLKVHDKTDERFPDNVIFVLENPVS